MLRIDCIVPAVFILLQEIMPEDRLPCVYGVYLLPCSARAKKSPTAGIGALQNGFRI